MLIYHRCKAATPFLQYASGSYTMVYNSWPSDCVDTVSASIQVLTNATANLAKYHEPIEYGTRREVEVLGTVGWGTQGSVKNLEFLRLNAIMHEQVLSVNFIEAAATPYAYVDFTITDDVGTAFNLATALAAAGVALPAANTYAYNAVPNPIRKWFRLAVTMVAPSAVGVDDGNVIVRFNDKSWLASDVFAGWSGKLHGMSTVDEETYTTVGAVAFTSASGIAAVRLDELRVQDSVIPRYKPPVHHMYNEPKYVGGSAFHGLSNLVF